MAFLIEEVKTKMIIHIFIIFSFFISNLSYAYAYGYDECSSTWSCGNATQIGYPFWGSGRPEYCGHPAFNLLCPSGLDSDNYPILQISNNDKEVFSFQVLGITISEKGIMTIKLLRLHPYYSCPTTFYMNSIPLSYSSNVSTITLVYDCPASAGINSSNADSLTCSHINIPSITSYYLWNQSVLDMIFSDGYKGCNYFEAPLLIDEMDKLESRKETLDAMLAKGFEVDFNYTACMKCQSSGGACASSNEPDTAVCYCKDAPPTIDVCPKLEKKLNVRLILGLGCLGAGVIILFVLVFRYIYKRKTRHLAFFSRRKGIQHQNIEAFFKVYGSLAPKRYTYANIRKMTNNFKEKIGEGGYATVYKGKLPQGRLVAVKLLKQVKDNGEDFINEVASISRTNHVNIVALLGFCFEGSKRSLIYEFMSNGSLERFTYRGASYISLSWEKVFDIALGIARGLDYLHRGCNARILHFDIKPHNILLDGEFNPKVSDFGLSRLCPQKESTISMLEARGTIGYIAPEVFCRNFGGVSHKSDVYSYGMMILDLVCGRKNTYEVQHSSEMYFPEWIYNRLELEEKVVPGILNEEEKELQKKMILVSLWCIQTYPSNRPSMSSVIEMLNGCLESIQMPPKPYISSPPRLVLYTSETSTTI